MAQEVIIMMTHGATSHDKVNIMTTQFSVQLLCVNILIVNQQRKLTVQEVTISWCFSYHGDWPPSNPRKLSWYSLKFQGFQRLSHDQ